MAVRTSRDRLTILSHALGAIERCFEANVRLDACCKPNVLRDRRQLALEREIDRVVDRITEEVSKLTCERLAQQLDQARQLAQDQFTLPKGA